MPEPSQSLRDKKETLSKSVEELKKVRLNESLSKITDKDKPENRLPVFDIKLRNDLDPTREYVIFKGIFRTRATKGAWGMFVFLAEKKVGQILALCMWTGYGGLRNATIDASWEALVSLMESEANGQDAQLREKVLKIFKRYFNAPEINLISKPEEEQDKEKVKNVETARAGFAQELSRQLATSFEVSLEMKDVPAEDVNYFETLSRELSDKPDNTATKEEDGEKDEKQSSKINRVTITCGVIVDPVRGKPISSLRPGDLVYITIREGSAIGSVIKQAMAKGRKDRLAATLVSTRKTNTGSIEIIVELSEGIYGKALVGDSYKLAIPHEKEVSYDSELLKSPLFWGIVASALLTLILFKMIFT